MDVRVINQPFGAQGTRLGDELEACLLSRSPGFTRAYWASAFAHYSGIGRLLGAMRDFRSRGGEIRVVVGINLRGTSWEALETLVHEVNGVFVYANPGRNTFHPKVFLFELPGKRAAAFVGSNNLTMAGLYLNNEICVRMDLDLGDPADAQAYASLYQAFTTISDENEGTVQQLDHSKINRLYESGVLLNESARPPRSQRLQGSAEYSLTLPGTDSSGRAQGPMFASQPIAPAPRLTEKAPTPPPLPPTLPTVQPPIQLPPPVVSPRPAPLITGMFVMVLGERDTRQQAGYSRDIYIPLMARSASEGFWGWPREFSQHITPRATYDERFLRLLVRPVAGPVHVRDDVRLYYYDRKHEFRLNCGPLVSGAEAGDILVIRAPEPGELYNGQPFDFEAAVIAQGSAPFESFDSACTQGVEGSRKRWGYL